MAKKPKFSKKHIARVQKIAAKNKALVLSGETFRSRKRTTRFIKHNDGK